MLFPDDEDDKSPEQTPDFGFEAQTEQKQAEPTATEVQGKLNTATAGAKEKKQKQVAKKAQVFQTENTNFENKPTLSSFSNKELFDELIKRFSDERVQILLNEANDNLAFLKFNIDKKAKEQFISKFFKEQVEGKALAAKRVAKS